jgi:predicted MFS family arabinose efflux permease
VPLHLRDHGLSASDIGLLLTAAAVVWVTTAPVAGRVRERRVGTVLVGLSTAVMGAIWLLPIGSPSVLAIAAFLVLSSACRAPLNTFVYVFGRRAATGTGVAPGSYVGVMNVAWAVAAVAGPVMAGAALGSAGPRWPYVIVAVPSVLVGAWLVTLGRPRLPAPLPAR